MGYFKIVTDYLKHQLRYRTDRRAWKKAGGKITHRYKIIYDYGDQAGEAKGHYFHQDLLVAQLVHQNQPRRHIDVGSRVDGFVAHVAAFRQIEIIDIRPLMVSTNENINYRQADMMKAGTQLPCADSVSCLHALEHFGLGRYGDPIDLEGHKKGFMNLVQMVEPDGRLYVSFPIADANEVHFNAHRIFKPDEIFSWPGAELLKLQRFDMVDDKGDLLTDLPISAVKFPLRYGCGIYSFVRLLDS